ncbi:hypothetical protein ACTWKA_05160 [Bacillus sp. 3A_MP1]
MKGHVAPFVMLRAAGGSIDSLACVDVKQTSENIEKILNLETEIEVMKEPLSDIFFHLISCLNDDETNFLRFLLKVKRDIFNSRPFQIDDKNRSELQKRLTVSDYKLFNRWYMAVHDRQRYMEDTKLIFEKEIEEAGQHLANEMENEEWQKGLALANPKYLSAYNKKKAKLWRPHKQYARTSMSYLGRITMKTSPFSTFTKIGLTSFQLITRLLIQIIKKRTFAAFLSQYAVNLFLRWRSITNYPSTCTTKKIKPSTLIKRTICGC